jgi:ankyrin repeat protein
VKYAREGDLQRVIDEYTKNPKTLEETGKRTEVQEKHGYSKQWTWNKDTALIAACRQGHLDVVNFLLSKGADVLASSSLSDDVHETALEVAAKKKCYTIVALLRTKVDEKNNEIAKQRAEAQAIYEKKVEMDRAAEAKKKEEIRNNLWETCCQPPSLVTLCCDRMHQVCPSGNNFSNYLLLPLPLPPSLIFYTFLLMIPT